MRGWVWSVAFLLAGCTADVPTAPTREVPSFYIPGPANPPEFFDLSRPGPSPADVSGLWIGDWIATFLRDGAEPIRGTLPIRVTLTQSGRVVAGRWLSDRQQGEITGVVNGEGAASRLEMTWTYDGEPATQTGRCRGQATLEGSAAASTEWRGAGFRLSCPEEVRNIQVHVTRQR